MPMRRSRSTPRIGSRLAIAATVAAVLLIGCAPGTSGGLTTVAPERADGAWIVRVDARSVGRGLLVRHSPFRSLTIPRGFVPPPGLCRVWRAELAPARQAPPGACDVLERDTPAGTYLIYG